MHPNLIACPVCKKPNIINVEAWKEDVSKVQKGQCQHCGNDVYIAMFVLANNTPKKINRMIEAIVSMVKSGKGNVNLITER